MAATDHDSPDIDNNFYYYLQVAALALLLVLEARCAHYVIAYFNNFFVL